MSKTNDILCEFGDIVVGCLLQETFAEVTLCVRSGERRLSLLDALDVERWRVVTSTAGGATGNEVLTLQRRVEDEVLRELENVKASDLRRLCFYADGPGLVCAAVAAPDSIYCEQHRDEEKRR